MREPRYIEPEQSFIETTNPYALPIDRPIAIYYRQSQFSQIGNSSTIFQLDYFPKYILSLGWTQDKLITIEDDAGISGTKNIRDRPGMSRLFDLITSASIGAVACTDEDRLFRDITQIQVNLFIQACREMDVRVITPSMIYNFTNESSRAYHSRQFRFKSEQAAEFVHLATQGRLYAAKQRSAAEGRWTGSPIPVGYILDARKVLQNGNANPNWRKLVPFEPYATVVRTYFELFLKLDGSLIKTFNHIEHHGPDYPDFESAEIQRQVPLEHRLYKPPSLKPVSGRYYPKLNSLIYLFTNATYAGHYVSQSRIVQWNNHPAIVPAELFHAVFNVLSPSTLDGDPNPHYHKYGRYKRISAPQPAHQLNQTRPLCEGMILSLRNGIYTSPRVQWDDKYKEYAYFLSRDAKGKYWQKRAAHFDEAVVQEFKGRLHSTFEASNWEAIPKSIALIDEKDDELSRQRRQLLDRDIKALLSDISTLHEDEALDSAQSELFRLIFEREQVNESLSKIPNTAFFLESLLLFKQQMEIKIENWSKLDVEQQRSILKIFVEKIVVNAPARFTLELTIFWRDQVETTTLLGQQLQSRTGPRLSWPRHTIDLVISQIEANASQLEIMASVPDRTWNSIRNILRRKLGRTVIISPKPIYDHETYADYQERTKGKTEIHCAKPGQRWSDIEIECLQALLTRDLDNVTIAKAFPHRRWRSIHEFIRQRFGRDFPLRADHTIRRNETIDMYWSRTGMVSSSSHAPSVAPTPVNQPLPPPFDMFILKDHFAKFIES